MQRNSIIGVAVVFCVIAALAGYLVTGMSSSGGATISALPGVPTLAGQPTEVIEELPSAIPTDEPTPTAGSAAEPEQPTAAAEPATAAPEATAAPAEPTAAPEPPTAAPAGPAFVEYTVKKGDVLQVIAKQYNVTVRDIIANNTIANPDSLIVGQVLRIPQ